YVINTRKKATLGEKLGLQAAQMADSLIPAVMNKVADTLAKANSTLVQMRDTKF
ncbi:MAG: protease SohB, partial [Acinetobacter baumannii]